MRLFAFPFKSGRFLSFHCERKSQMASEFIAGLGLFKTAFDIAKGLKDINDATVRNGAIIELQEIILSAREQQAAALERISQLEKQVADFETWEAEKQRYELKSLPPGGLVHSIKEAMRNGEPPHYICANCFEHRKKSPLQSGGVNNGLESLTCNECGAKIRTGHFVEPRVLR
jgi:hypothetical protein